MGPMEEISFNGHPVAYISPSSYGHSHVRLFVFVAQFTLNGKRFFLIVSCFCA